MRAKQLELFPVTESTPDPEAADSTGTQPAARALAGEPSLVARSSLKAAIDEFPGYMRDKGFTQHTIDSFLGDLSILTHYLKPERAIGSISTRDLREFLQWLLHGRGRPCNAKSYARRLTTLKVFFQWLAETSAIPVDPAAPIVHEPVSTPLPQILYDEEVERLLAAAQMARTGEKPDVRPLLLFRLLLATGIKKAECMAIKLGDLDLSQDDVAVLFVRYEHPRRKHKERKLAVGAGFASLVREYRSQYHPQVHLFECTNRNLEYVLRDLGRAAAIDKPVSFETLRMTCAVRDFRRGVDSEARRLKLGLSHISWEETSKKIELLGSEPL